MDHIKSYLQFYNSLVASRDSRDYLYVWEGSVVEFHGLAYSSSNSPSWWSWISCGGLMLLDVLLGEVHEKIEGICSTEGKNRGAYGIGVHSMWVVLLCQWVHQGNWRDTRGIDLGWWTWWGHNGRGFIGNKRKKVLDKE